ncbi:TIR domain-containing protein [Hymenobacter weizhouensis]|uniref:TIR domain-containing protein n=1 Tax=Hymenobacter sp. YIM 151500-1 TaxID=2987689 RepID=UPI002226337E|nr:TIR domain-containing protein [Hymenobacter sp. YIM 151500-1]UYZ64894.1 nucleotide-binding protein [Hymenobacter sp. YIM 151500-1]
MKQKFAGDDNLPKLINSLKKQAIINGDKDVALAIAQQGELIEFDKGDTIIVQDNTDDDVIFILTGRVVITVNGREVAYRNPGQHVGEMALIDPSLRRSASVIAEENTVVVKVSEKQFTPIAEQHPELWRRIAEGLAERLIQRNELVETPNANPTIFIGSSSEALSIARAVQANFQHDDYLVRVWVDKIFGAGNATIEDLEHQLKTSDFAILIISPDDKVVSRKEEADAPRDNVIFELGLFMGALTRHRTFLAVPRGKKDLKIPSDLLGITPLQYTVGEPDDLPTLVAPMCEDIRKIVRKLGTK